MTAPPSRPTRNRGRWIDARSARTITGFRDRDGHFHRIRSRVDRILVRLLILSGLPRRSHFAGWRLEDGRIAIGNKSKTYFYVLTDQTSLTAYRRIRRQLYMDHKARHLLASIRKEYS